MIHNLVYPPEISLTNFRKVISETLNSDGVQVVTVKKGKKKAIIDLDLLNEMYIAYQNEQWEKSFSELNNRVSSRVQKSIGNQKFEKLNSIEDLDLLVEVTNKIFK